MYYTIRTTDGNRFDWIPPNGENLMNEMMYGSLKLTKFIGLAFDGGIKYFNVNHIVSITEHQEN